jgi:hypothetical protein
MDSLHREADKAKTTMAHFERALAASNLDLAMASAKRARRQLTMVVQLLAEIRDRDATRQEATSNE